MNETENLRSAYQTSQWQVQSNGFEISVFIAGGWVKFQIQAFDNGWGPCTESEARDEWAVNWWSHMEITGPTRLSELDDRAYYELASQIMDRVVPQAV
jgi:hypothetical protein